MKLLSMLAVIGLVQISLGEKTLDQIRDGFKAMDGVKSKNVDDLIIILQMLAMVHRSTESEWDACVATLLTLAVDEGFSRTNRTVFDVWQKYTKNLIEFKFSGDIETNSSPDEIIAKKLKIILAKELNTSKTNEAMGFMSILRTPSLSEKRKEIDLYVFAFHNALGVSKGKTCAILFADETDVNCSKYGI
ncbi:uncharacterized protein LOC129575321 [Sitodiplosis mosellana]|uniref:uncharacterized protein LOC129575321 n=1 Tax=Sitodiplosis mosellana TaxID=263140 RepID=UPI002443A50D|nr:uncharacterized protein LOC129575321 [Sitodiplosis mosellana]